MKFKIEQIALFPPEGARARKLLDEIGAGPWAHDQVVAKGEVIGRNAENVGELSFEYDLLDNARELEVLQYSEGDHWMQHETPRVSHFGMHCTAEELVQWRKFFVQRGIAIAQEVKTQSHTNPHIAGKRWYHYVIFDTHAILGVDLKFIVRHDSPDF